MERSAALPAAYALSIGRPSTFATDVVNTTPLPSASSGASFCTVKYGLELVADGRAVAIVPADDRRCTLREDLATVPVDGIEPCQVAVFTRADDRNPLVAHFRESAKNLLIRGA